MSKHVQFTEKTWISTKDKLPRMGKNVLICWKNYQGKKFIDIAEFFTNGAEWHFVYCDVDGTNGLDESQVTHWMPLPHYPKSQP